MLYLHNDPTPPTGDTTFQAILPLDQNAPSATTLYNYDNLDAFPGRLIEKGASGPTEADATKFQAWRTVPLTSDLTVGGGVVSVVLWTGIKDFNPGVPGSVTIFLRHFDGLSYTEIGQGSRTVPDWQGGSSSWISRNITITGVNYTIPAGHQLEVKLIVDASSGDHMWIAYDTVSYDSRVELP